MLSIIRSLRRRPVFALVAILTIALGIGANTALFGVVYAVLLEPLPFRDPGRLVQIWNTHPALPQLQLTVPDYVDLRAQTQSFESVAAHTLAAMNNGTLLGQGEPAPVHGTMASSGLFSEMGIRPIAGRPFSEAEEAAREKVVLLSETLWRHKFGGDQGVIGRQIRVDQQSFRVLGIVGRRQAFPEWADFWIPLSLAEPDLVTRRKYHPLEVIARLKPGVTVEQAQSEVAGFARRMAQAHPETNANIGAYVIGLDREITGSVRPSLLLAWAAVGLVLLIACANLAHLFLARIVERRQEMAIREALGAGTWRLIRRLLGESLAIAAAGGAAGMVLAIWAGDAARKLAASQIPRVEWMSFGAPEWLFALGISAIAGALFAVPACWQVMRSRTRLAGAGRSIARGRSRLSAALLAGEVSMAVLVASGAVLLLRNFAELLHQDPGFQARQVWVVPNLPAGKRLEAILASIRESPGVSEVAAVNSAPMSLGATEHSRFATRFGIAGRTFEPGSYPVAQNRWMTPEYLRVLGVPLKSGRWLTEADANQPRLLVNQTLARRFFPGQNAVGRHIVFGVMDPQQQAQEIVGVVGDVRDFGLDHEPEPAVYGIGAGPVMTIVVKAAAPPADAVRAAIHRAGPEIPVSAVQPLAQNVADSLARRRFILTLLGIFAALAALLTAGGIYGLMTHSVNARLREMGVRAAVGASPRELVRMILRETLLLTAPGLAAGAVLAVAFARVMKTLVYRLSPADPVSIAAAVGLLVVLAVVSAWLPARRAAGVDPAVALRAE